MKNDKYEDENENVNSVNTEILKLKKTAIKLVVGGVILLIVLIIVFGSFYTIPAGYRGVLLTFDKPSATAFGEGLHVKIPIIQKVVKMDTRTQKYESDLTAASSDLQDVMTKIAINYHLSPESTVDIYRTIGIDYANKIIYPLEQEANKASTAQFTAEELITKREIVRTNMEKILREKLAPRGIVVESISIVNFKFSDVFSNAIEQKVTATQLKLKAVQDLERIKVEAEQRVTQATAEAEAIKIQAEAVTQQGGKDYVQLQWILKWNGQQPQVVGSNTPLINLGPLV
jgi:regulator of protease activity HflC (stomatin/prohibitin superfamily)